MNDIIIETDEEMTYYTNILDHFLLEEEKGISHLLSLFPYRYLVFLSTIYDKISSNCFLLCLITLQHLYFNKLGNTFSSSFLQELI